MHALALALTVWALAFGGAAQPPSDRLAAIKAFYASADYERALDALAAPDAGLAPDEADKYRALCLLALGRMDDVARLLDALVVRSPSYRMTDADVSPRLVALFHETRRRLLPGIFNDRYTTAKKSFDEGRYADAGSQFRSLIALLGSDTAGPDVDATVVRDLRHVAETFLALTETAMTNQAKTDDANRARADADQAATATAAAAAAAALQDEAAIGLVIQSYVRAYSTLDVDTVIRLFPAENPGPLRAAFSALKSQRVQGRNVAIAVDPGGWSATARLTWIVEAVPKVGSSRKTQTPTTLRLLKLVTGEWSIVGRR